MSPLGDGSLSVDSRMGSKQTSRRPSPGPSKADAERARREWRERAEEGDADAAYVSVRYVSLRNARVRAQGRSVAKAGYLQVYVGHIGAAVIGIPVEDAEPSQ